MYDSNSDLLQVGEGRVLGIDASNLRAGGGITHLRMMLGASALEVSGFARVIIWCGTNTAKELVHLSPLFDVRIVRVLDRGVLVRLIWQQLVLRSIAERSVDILFNPGCGYCGGFRPYVTMFRNMLPFDDTERRRFGRSLAGLRYFVLRISQSRCIRNADGAIFLSYYGRDSVIARIGQISGKISMIAHGVSEKYRLPPRPQLPIQSYSWEKPFVITYVSIIDYYKHQWNVAEAVITIRKSGLPVVLRLIGRKVDGAGAILDDVINDLDPNHEVVKVLGPLYGNDLLKEYHSANLFVFGSTCENLPNVLLEAMASGLPIVCSDKRPMTDILGDSGVYANMESTVDIVTKINKAIHDADLRARLARVGFERSEDYSWKKCATDTFRFLRNVRDQSMEGGKK